MRVHEDADMSASPMSGEDTWVRPIKRRPIALPMSPIHVAGKRARERSPSRWLSRDIRFEEQTEPAGEIECVFFSAVDVRSPFQHR
jgi:hypothetical protein